MWEFCRRLFDSDLMPQGHLVSDAVIGLALVREGEP